MSEATLFATKLAAAVYRLTDALPETEPLRIKLREAALDIAAKSSRETAYAIEAMSALLRVAEAQGFAHEENFALLNRAYGKLQELRQPEEVVPPPLDEPSRMSRIEPSESASERDPIGHGTVLKILNARQKKIVQHFHYGQVFQLREARALFEGYSQKTLRNDLRDLCTKGILNREGVGTVSFYRVVFKMPNP